MELGENEDETQKGLGTVRGVRRGRWGKDGRGTREDGVDK